MTRQAKVVAMTCTHAALKRREFLELAFQYDSLVMEESAQILEIETFIPMLLQVGPHTCSEVRPRTRSCTHTLDLHSQTTCGLSHGWCVVPQKPEGGRSRLKRVVMIGDHHQLPPVVKNQAFQKYAHLDQSLFTRFVRLGTPYLELNAQVRWEYCRSLHLCHWDQRTRPGLPGWRLCHVMASMGPCFTV